MTCSHCGNHNPEGSPFCGSCGKSLKTTVDCNSCGEENPAESLFCGSCGISFFQTFSFDSCGEENPSGSLFCGSCGIRFETREQKDNSSNYSPQEFLTRIFQYPPKYFWVLLICVLTGGLHYGGYPPAKPPLMTKLLIHIPLLSPYNGIQKLRLPLPSSKM